MLSYFANHFNLKLTELKSKTLYIQIQLKINCFTKMKKLNNPA